MQDYLNKFFIIIICLFFVSCAARQPIKMPADDESTLEPSESSVLEEDETLYPPEPEEDIQVPSPRDQASLELTEKAIMLLDENKPDESIRSLDKARIISPGRGENYYYLAEAWYMKGDLSQAKEYNSLASIYLKDDADWMVRVNEQKVRIESSR